MPDLTVDNESYTVLYAQNSLNSSCILLHHGNLSDIFYRKSIAITLTMFACAKDRPFTTTPIYSFFFRHNQN